MPYLRPHLLIAVALISIATCIGIVRGTVVRFLDATPELTAAWVYIPGDVLKGTPIVAWYALQQSGYVEAGHTAWVQLRVCNPLGECVLGSRAPISSQSQGGLLSGFVDLTAGTYTVEFLLIHSGRFGVTRTIQATSGAVLIHNE